MKTKLLITILLIAGLGAHAQTWQRVGERYFGQTFAGYASYCRMAIDRQGNVYVTFYDLKEVGKITVRKFDGSSWKDAGSPLNSSQSGGSRVAVDPQGIPWLIYRDQKLVARKLVNDSWLIAGVYTENISPDAIAIDSAGTAYVSYINLMDNERPTVIRQVGDQWEVVGKKAFAQRSSDTQLVIARDGTPYLACTSISGQRGSVWKFNGADWEVVGDTTLMEQVTWPRLAVDRAGTPYLAYVDASDGNKATVSKFNGDTWETVGPAAFVPVLVTNFNIPVDIALDAAGKPYVAFVDQQHEGKATVMQLKDNQWEPAGNIAFSDIEIDGIMIATDGAGTPYVTYSDKHTGYDNILYKPRVKRLNGTVWESLGDDGITGEYGYLLSSATDAKGALYLAYSHGLPYIYDVKSHYTTVLKYEDAQWKKMGADHHWDATKEQMAVSAKGTPYLAYLSGINNDRISVERFDGENWQMVGMERFARSQSGPSIAIDTSGTPYVAYGYGTNGQTTWVQKFNGMNWVQVGQSGVGDSTAQPSIAIDKAGTPYAAYMDQTHNGSVVVKKFVNNEWTTVGHQYLALTPVYNYQLAIDPGGTPWLMINWNNLRLTVERLKGDEWENVFDDSQPAIPYADQLVFDKEGNVYIPIADRSKDSKASVIKYDGKSWTYLGEAGFTSNRAFQLELMVDGEGSPHLIHSYEGLWHYQYLRDCLNPTDGGTIAGSQKGCGFLDPEPITSVNAPYGFAGTLEYKWQSIAVGSTGGFVDIQSNGETYDPGLLTKTTWFKRLAKAACISSWEGAAESNTVKMTVVTFPEIACPPDDTIPNDLGSLFARKSYSALPGGAFDTLVVYRVNGLPITFPYDFPVGSTVVEVTANNSCAVDLNCSFTVTVKQATAIPALEANSPAVEVFPNPFTSEVTIEVANPLRKAVNIEIYSISGQKIRSLLRAQKGAKISCAWDGRDESGKQVPKGLYLLKVNGGMRKVVKK